MASDFEKGNVATAYSNPPSNGGSENGHYGENTGIYMNEGEAMGESILDLLSGKR